MGDFKGAGERSGTALLGIIGMMVSSMALTAVEAADPSQLDRGASLWETVEWTVKSPGVAGNPFDLEATVTFTHEESGARRRTAMFYKGGDIWAWRFTGTRPGEWTFATESGDDSLHGLSGEVNVSDERHEGACGFIRPKGPMWARQTSGQDQLEAFVPQLVMYEPHPRRYFQNPEKIRRDVARFIDEHGFSGFHVPTVGGQWFDIESDTGHGGTTVSEEMVNPDPKTFAALEALIQAAHKAGAMVHIWAWGDQARGQTPINLPGGVNGERDRRLQRYIAARLGPLPGWTMGYGFDLDEWAGAPEDPSRVEAWRDYIDQHSGWGHLLGGRPIGPNRGRDHTQNAPWNKGLDYASYEHHEPTYEVYVAALEADVDGEPLAKPVFSEDRFRIRGLDGPGKDYTESQTRRGLWISTMAGGVANIWGNLTRPDGESKRGGLSYEYPHREWIKTYDTFFFERERFSAAVERANDLVPQDNVVALADRERGRIIVFAEETAAVELDLRSYDAAFDVTAVDTTTAYKEIETGTLESGAVREWTAPGGRQSDWALVLKTRQYSKLWGEHGEAWSPRSRLPDFSFAGYHRGEEALPNVEASIDVTDHGAIPNDGNDDTAAFQDALDAVDQGAVFVPAGRYIITDFLDIRRPGIILQGAGADETTLYFPKTLTDVESNWGATTSGRRTSNYSWSGGFVRLRGDYQSRTLTHLSKPAERGDRRVTVGSTSDLSVGQEVEVFQEDTSKNSLAVHLYTGDPGRIENLNGRTETSLVARITEIDGNRITLDRPLRCDHRLKWEPRIRQFEPTVYDSGVEGLTFEFPNTPYEGHFTELGRNAITFREVADCWVRDLRIINCDSGLFIRGMFNTVTGLVIESERRPDEDRNSTGHHGLTFTGADNLLTRFDIRTRFIHDITVSHHTSGNVISDGKGDDLSLDHHRYANFENLFTEIDAGKGARLWRCGGGAALGKHCGARGTFWNIRADRSLRYPPDSFGPVSMNLVGLETDEQGTTDPDGKWFEVVPPEELAPQNLYRAQLHRRMGGH